MDNGMRLPEQIRVSTGSAVILGLFSARLDAFPTTIYLMTYTGGKCTANCGFCPQAKGSYGRADMLSRISWPQYPTKRVITETRRVFKEARTRRVCIQALNYPEVFTDLVALVSAIFKQTRMPISVSCQPLKEENIAALAEAGVERMGIPLDAATEEIFNKTKGACVGGPYSWEAQIRLLKEAVDVLGKGKVSTHLIVGLGETEKQMVEIIQTCADMEVLPGLFAFTPVLGTALADKPRPSIEKYRRIQLARDLILNGIARYGDMGFDDEGNLLGFGVDERILRKVVDRGEAFLTSGCPDCNRPYYNEKPSGPIYNYPRKVTEDELSEIEGQLGLL